MPRCVAIDQQQRNAARTLPARAHGRREEISPHPGRDERLLARHHEMVAVPGGDSAQRGNVGATRGLRDGERSDSFAGEHRRQHARLQFRAAEQGDQRATDRVRHQRSDHSARAALGELHARDQPVEGVGPGDAAVLLGEAETQQPHIGSLAIQVPREGLRLVPVVDVGSDLARDEAPHGLAEVEVFGTIVGGVESEFVHLIDASEPAGSRQAHDGCVAAQWPAAQESGLGPKHVPGDSGWRR